MSDERKLARFGHCEGYTDVCFDESGRYLISCGTDGDIRIWNGFHDENPVSHTLGECVHAVFLKGSRLFVGSDSNSVQAYTFPEVQPDGVIASFSSPVTNIHVCRNYLVAGAGDFSIKVVELKVSSQRILQGHSAPILSVGLDPQEEYVASSSCDGSVRVWKLSDGNCVKTWNVLPKSNDFCMSKTLGRVKWHPDTGKCLIVPADSELQIYERSSWNILYSLKDDFCKELFSLVSFSSGGKYLAAATSSGRILVWDFKTRICIEREVHEEGMICGLEWNPSGEDTLVFSDFHGQLGTLVRIGKQSNDKMKGSDEQIELLDSSDKVNFNEHDKPAVDSDYDEDMDIGALKATYNKRIFVDETEDGFEESKPLLEVAPASDLRATVSQTLLPVQQPPFQPGSTPTHLEHRFMIWNTTGFVRCYNTDDESSLDVEFHDTTLHHSVHIANTLCHTICDLSNEALLLACKADDAENSKIVCMHFATWDSNKEWKAELPEGEDAEALALGTGWAAVATNKQLLRLFTIGGIQGGVISVPGPIVCISAMENILLVVYHCAAGAVGNQSLGLMRCLVRNRNTFSVHSQHPLPLSQKSVLSWLGFTDEGTPTTVDSEGLIRLLTKGNAWIPVANTKSHTKGKSDHYFVVGLSEIQQQIRCIPCKGSRYPPTLPHPSVAVLPFKLPLCDLTSDKGKLEEEYWRLENLNELLTRLVQQDFEVDREFEECKKKKVEVLLRMFALSTRNHKEFQALEISEMMPNAQVLQGAIRYATQRHCITLAERISELAQQKMDEQPLADHPDDFEEEEDDSLSVQISRHSNQSNEQVIQPKSLSFSRLDSSNKESLIETENNDNNLLENGKNVTCEELSNSLEEGHQSPIQKNPFKMSSQQKKKNVVGMDGILQDCMDEAAKRIKRLTPPQPLKAYKKVNTANSAGKSSVASAQQLFMQEMKAEVAAENPELDEDDVTKLVVQQFKQLPQVEKQKWQKKAKEEGNQKKRKPESIEPSNKKIKKELPISEKTAGKLTQFMFRQKEC